MAGAVIARTLADTSKYLITIIDKRNHIAGNTYDPWCSNTGQRFHKYGPHIFHTNSETILTFINKYGKWLPYKHKVKAYVEGIGQVSLPINRDTLNTLYSKRLKSIKETKQFLETLREPYTAPKNAYEYLTNIYGSELTTLFFSGYTKKMWDLDLKELSVATVKRLPIRYDANPYYFNDKYQLMPAEGYLTFFTNLLSHPSINIRLSETFDHRMEDNYFHVFNSMPIDEYFNFQFGKLPYRSIIFSDAKLDRFTPTVPTVNFTDNRPCTRVTQWSLYPGLSSGHSDKYTYETPCSYEENNNERYYPIKTIDKNPQVIYQKYRSLLTSCLSETTFIGRCGQYQYYDMDQVIANSLNISNNFLKEQ